jgi:hypothetical protein
MSMDNDPGSARAAAAQRGFRHWTIIGIVVVFLIGVFLLRR